MRFPGAEWRPIGCNYSGDGQAPRYVVVHIMEGSLGGSDSWFRNPDAQASAHFGVGKDGTCYQWVDTDDKAWHNAGGNSVSIGIENEGYAGQSLTEAQLSKNADILAWAHGTHGVPLRLAQSVYDTGGLAWHGMGGSYWGGHTGCPGTPIVGQLPGILSRASGPEPAPPASPNLFLEENSMYLPHGPAGTNLPITIPNGARVLRFYATTNCAGKLDWIGVTANSVDFDLTSAAHAQFPVPSGCKAARFVRKDGSDAEICVSPSE